MGVFKVLRALFGGGKETTAHSPVKFFEQRGSFAFVAVVGDGREHIPSLLIDAGYTPKRAMDGRGSPEGVVEELHRLTPQDRGTSNTSYKAMFVTPTHTVLLDPDSIVCCCDKALIALAKKMNSVVVSTIWERVSESIHFATYSPDGILQKTFLVEGEPQTAELVNPNQRLIQNPEVEQLLSELKAVGIADAFFSTSSDVTIIEALENAASAR